MALHTIEIDGEVARSVVRFAWPHATSAYVGANMAQVYDADSGFVLGEAECSEFAVEQAWIAAAKTPSFRLSPSGAHKKITGNA